MYNITEFISLPRWPLLNSTNLIRKEREPSTHYLFYVFVIYNIGPMLDILLFHEVGISIGQGVKVTEHLQ